jgi:hypothetical protein
MTTNFKNFPYGASPDTVSLWKCDCGQFGEGTVDFDRHTSGCPTMLVKSYEEEDDLDDICPDCLGTGIVQSGERIGKLCGIPEYARW